MLSSVLRSEQAVQVNIAIMRAFVRMREILATHKDLARKIEALERKDLELEVQSNVRTVMIVLLDDRLRAYVVFNLYGKDLSLTLEGRLRAENWLWGPRGNDGKVLIILGGSEERLSRGFDSCEQAATFEYDYCMPYENHRPVWVCRDLKVPMKDFWTAIKSFN